MMGGERQQRRMKPDGVVLPLEHRALEVVVEHDPGRPAEGGEGPGMAGQEAAHARVEEEA